MITGDLKTIREIDKVLSETCVLVKDSSKSGSKAYTKIYEAKGNPVFTRIRIFFDEREKKGTIKIKDYHPLMCGIATFTLIQTFMLIEESISNLVSSL